MDRCIGSFFVDSRLTRPADCDLSRLEPPSEAAPIVTRTGSTGDLTPPFHPRPYSSYRLQLPQTHRMEEKNEI